jgi:hypothetical protein
MTAQTIVTLKEDFYNVLKTSTAAPSVAVRAALGAGATSIIPREDLRAASLPTAPFIAVAYGPMPGTREDVRTLFPTLWLYDDAGGRWRRINTVAALVDAAYPFDILPYADVRLAPGYGEELTDYSLARPTMAMRYTVKARF